MATIAYASPYKLGYNLGYNVAAGYGISGVINPATTLTTETTFWPSRIQKRYGFTKFAGTVPPTPPPG